MPMAHDQPDNAERLIRLGVGRSLPPRAFNEANLRAALDASIDRPAGRRAAAALKEKLQADRATDMMVDWIQSRVRV